MQDLQYAACGFEIVLLGKWIFFFFYEFDLMTNGLSVYNGCQSRVSVETCAFEFLHFEFMKNIFSLIELGRLNRICVNWSWYWTLSSQYVKKRHLAINTCFYIISNTGFWFQ